MTVEHDEQGCKSPSQHGSDGSSDRAEQLEIYDEQVARRLSGTPPDIMERAEDLLDDPNLLNRVADDIRASGVVGEESLVKTLFITGVSRLLEKPLAVIVQGTTSSGKSYGIERTSRFFAPESLVVATSITANALYYKEPGSLIHRFVVTGERSRIQDDQHAEATRALREMLASGELSKEVTEHKGSRNQTISVHQHGPISYAESTTSATIDDEDANRCLLVATDESPQQTRRVIDAIAASAAGSHSDINDIFAVHHAAQRMLRRVRVVVPFAGELAAAMPDARPEARRAINHVLSVIQAITVLYQWQRVAGEIQHGDEIKASVADYAIARELLLSPLGRGLGQALPAAVERFARSLLERYPSGESFTWKEALRGDDVITAKSKCNAYLAVLETAGCAELVEQHHGNKPATWKMTDQPPEPGAKWLPDVESLRDGVPPPVVPGVTGSQPANLSRSRAPAAQGGSGPPGVAGSHDPERTRDPERLPRGQGHLSNCAVKGSAVRTRDPEDDWKQVVRDLKAELTRKFQGDPELPEMLVQFGEWTEFFVDESMVPLKDAAKFAHERVLRDKERGAA